jgi:hypothetical protein
VLAIRSSRYVVNDKPLPRISRPVTGPSESVPHPCFGPCFLSALADVRNIDRVANTGTNRASLPDWGVLFAVFLRGRTRPRHGGMCDSSHLEAVVITKGPVAAMFLSISLTRRRQVLHGWGPCVEADSVPKPLAEISMDSLSLFGLPILPGVNFHGSPCFNIIIMAPIGASLGAHPIYFKGSSRLHSFCIFHTLITCSRYLRSSLALIFHTCY